MKTVPIEKTTVDLKSGETVTKAVGATLMPPASDACQICGQWPAHPEGEPHNAQSLYYQYAFYGERGRWPTWADAIAHCSPEVRSQWEQALREHGMWSEP